MLLPSRAEAENELTLAERKNPGAWAEHSRVTARAAEAIARRCPGLNADTAYVAGLLHDVGRRVGICKDHHMPEGYRYCLAKGWPALAQICISHGYMVPQPGMALGPIDLTPADVALIETVLATATYTDYDRLIQLCDALALPTGFCLLETRFVDVALRYGTPPSTLPRWRKIMDLKRYFEEKMGCDLYAALPGPTRHL